MTSADWTGVPSSDSVAAAVERGRTLLQLQRPLDAERELRGVLAREPDNALGLALLALALSEQHRSVEAIEAANASVGLDPEWWYTHFTAGQVLQVAGMHGEALRAARAAMAIDPSDSLVWDLLTRVHLSRNEAWDAGQAGWEGLRRRPDDSDLVALLALAMTALGRSPQAIAHAEQALRLDPEDSFVHVAYGHAALGARRPDAAITAFRTALRLDPRNEAVVPALVGALKKRNLIYRAVSRPLDRLARTDPWLPFVVWGMVLVLRWAQLAVDSVLTLLISRDPDVRLLVAGDRRTARRAVVALAAGVLLLVAAVLSRNPIPGAVGLVVLGLVTPIHEAASADSVQKRRLILALTAVLPCLATATLLVLALRSPDPYPWARAIALMAGVTLLASVIAA